MQSHATETNQNTVVLFFFSIFNMKKLFSIVSPPTFHLAPRSPAIKCGLRTEYKTRTGYKTRTTDYVNKNSLRKVKLREMESRKTSKNSSPSFNIPLAVHVVYFFHGEGRLRRYSRQLKFNSEFYKKKELEEISICSFKPIRSTELKK